MELENVPLAHPHTLTINSASDKLGKSSKLQRHTEEMEMIIQKLLKIKKLEYSNTPAFLKEFEQLLPFVYAEIPDDAPGEIALYPISRNHKRHILSQFFSEMIQRWLIPWGQAEIVS